MIDKVSVNKNIDSPYIEKGGKIYRTKRKLTYAQAFRLLGKFLEIKPQLEILEIGTGSGFFLEFAKERFPDASFTGLEYDDRLLAETSFRAPNVNLVQGNAENFNLGLHRYDLIVSFQVIEHLFDPSRMLSNVRAHLKPGGVFLLTTPNLSGLGARCMGNRWHGHRHDHVSLKGKDEWDALIVDHGFCSLYSGSTFFSGIPLLNKFPLGLINWVLLLIFGSLRWPWGESYIGVFKSTHRAPHHEI